MLHWQELTQAECNSLEKVKKKKRSHKEIGGDDGLGDIESGDPAGR